MTDASNEKLKRVLQLAQTVLVILAVLYFVIDRMVLPAVVVTKSTENAAQIASRLNETLAIENRITKLESGQDYIKAMLEKIDGNLARHIEKTK